MDEVGPKFLKALDVVHQTARSNAEEKYVVLALHSFEPYTWTSSFRDW